jgi:DNA-binding CsgD family transcriptional regulator
MLQGRGAEQAAIDRLLEAVCTGEGGGLVLRGEPGIGKSALLAYAGQRAADLRVLHAVGVAQESMLAYATLQSLLGPVLGAAERLAGPQARALRAAFGFEEGEPADRFLIAMAALTLLSEVAGEKPVVCLIDDLQWADRPSAEALAFVGRRLEAEPVAVVAAIREGEGLDVDMAGMSELHLTGLDPDAAGALLDSRWGPRLTPAVRDRLVHATGGNPLALLELPGSLSGWQVAGRDPLPEPLPLSEELIRVFRERAHRREPEVQRLLLLAAAEGSGQLATIRRAADRLQLDPAPLESRDLSDLVSLEGATILFRHPLVHAAVYQGVSPSARREAHRALAEALEGDEAQADRRAWHQGQAAPGPDEEAAGLLERSAARALRRSGYAAAAGALDRAAELSLADEDRARRLVAAAGASWNGGDTVRARGYLERAERLAPGRMATRLELRHLRGLIEMSAGIPADGLAILLQAARDAVQLDTRRAVRLLLAAREAAFQSGDEHAVHEIDRLVAVLPPGEDPDEMLVIRLFRFLVHRMRGEGSTVTSRDLARTEELDDPELLARTGGIVWGLGDHALGRRLRARAVARARSLGAAGTLAWTLEYLVSDEIARGRYASAEAYADEGRRLALEARRPNSACLHLGSLAEIAALRGREQDARRLAEDTLAEATERRLGKAVIAARRAIGTLALATGQAEQALEQYAALAESGYRGTALPTTPDLVEAAVRAGRAERSQEPLSRYLAWAEAVRSSELGALAERSRALLASGEDANRRFQEALRQHARTDSPFEHARTELLYGEYLRRERRRVEARPHLRTALETFEMLGAPIWAERARRELRATGETARKRNRSTLDQLTPQELHVVRVISQGLTNREAAAQLFISPRTVDYHLRKVFSKLGINSRAELIRAAMTEEWLGDQPVHPSA